MPLTPSTTDKFLKVGVPGTATTLAAPGYTIGNSSINVGSTSNWSTDTPVIFAIDNAQVVNGVATRIAGSYCEFFGIVSSATSVGNLSLQYGSAQNYVAGSLTRVYIPVTGTRENMLIDGLNQDHNGKGNHKSLTDDNGNAWLTRAQVASAVNSLQVSNAVTGSPPLLAPVGSDTNIDFQLNPKGTGIVKVDGSAPRQFFALFNFVESGCVWTADAPGSTLLASMSSGFVWINGKRLSVAAVSHRAFTTVTDTYVDFQDNGDGTALIIYTTAANNAVSPAIPNSKTDATNIRDAIVVAGASSIASAASINQGQETALLPIASSTPYQVTDSLGNLIFPCDPNRKLLGLRYLTANFVTSSTTFVDITGLNLFVFNPANRKIKIAYEFPGNANIGGGTVIFNLLDVTNASAIVRQPAYNPGNTLAQTYYDDCVTTPPAAGYRNYKLQVKVGSGQFNAEWSSQSTAGCLRIELE